MKPAAAFVIAAAVCAAMHVAKLPPAITALQLALSITLVQAAFLLSMVQLAGMGLGVLVGAGADQLGARRSMLIGLWTLGVASAIGGAVSHVGLLMALRAAEGFGFLLVVLPGPGWLRRMVSAQALNTTLGLWGTYMPIATALALLIGPVVSAEWGWRWWWWGLAALSALMATLLARATAPLAAADALSTGRALRSRLGAALRTTLRAPGPWWVALVFALYAFQWLAVVGFLPTVYQQAGYSAAATGALTALVAAVNVVGNLSAGRLLQRGWAPTRLLGIGFVAMGLAALGLYGACKGVGLTPPMRYFCALAFSMFGGLIPATLFTLAVRVAPGPQAMATTLGWVQQGSAAGQFAGPPMVAAMANAAGGWQLSWVVTGGAALLAMLLLAPLRRCLRNA